ncbi:RNA polymerase sigma factor [Paraburkholderia silviterrae]|uniref:RNA polymerase sigma factor n=2 Tax=Paraburkholderia silviterrae TaxID=2528715 RepID=A0A4R5LXL8_9BURK|nr:RNA polymerase sigma factor [Paraburkholderia silviterrae]TDG16871.1 RNA polymerase sigma factor [Paraburkholderia silviterrae]
MADVYSSGLTDADAEIVRRIVSGDLAAFELLMRRHNRRLFRLARATLRNDAEAEDALQDAYLKAFNALAQFRGDAALATWLSRLVLNECFGRMRREARRQNLMPTLLNGADDEQMAFDMDPTNVHDDFAPDQAASRAEIRALLERKLDALPVGFRTVFVLRSVEEMSIEETAQCLGIAEATVRSRHFRARQMLRDSLAGEVDSLGPALFEFGGTCCDRIVAAVLARLRER